MENEIWKDVPNYNGMYQVNNLGVVKSFKKHKGTSERILKPSLDKDGYLQVVLSENSRLKVIRVHKLVQISFCLGDGFIDHIDGDRINNNISNLRLVTSRENNQNRLKHRNGGLVGASFIKALSNNKKPWQSKIRIEGVQKGLGYFKTELEAHNAYKEALSKLNKNRLKRS